MTAQLTDNTGEAVTVRFVPSEPTGAYTISIGDGEPVGSVEYADLPGDDHERVFFHTEVDPEFGGRDLAGVLVREVLADSIRQQVVVVPVCPVVRRELDKHGDQFTADGGQFRIPHPSDIDMVRNILESRS